MGNLLEKSLLCVVMLIFLVMSCFNTIPNEKENTEFRAFTISTNGSEYDICEVNPKINDIGILSYKKNGIKKVSELLDSHKDLVFATNGGIFEPDYSTSGLLIQNGELLDSLNLKKGKGNFYLKPNAVFILTDDGLPRLLESSGFEYEGLDNIRIGLQSGPVLLLNNKIHPAFNEQSKNKRLRSGIGINGKGNLVFAISKGKVNFYSFAKLFQKELDCKNALYLDGGISEMYCKTLENAGGFSHDFATIIHF